MRKVILSACLLCFCVGITAQDGRPKKDRERKKMAEITSVISISNMQRKGIHDALSRKREGTEALDSTLTAREAAFRKYAIDKECHEELVRQLSDRQIAEYCNAVFAPEVEAKTAYRMSLLTEVDNDYTEKELAVARKEIYRYLMLEKIVYFKYKYDFARQKENISRLKAIQPAALKSSLNNEKQKGYGKVMSGRVSWHHGNRNGHRGRNGR
ncbi:MAG: hypothetical protein NC124_16775 [Clostridium sp.]|nr:hypothetical protein [Bacteroidales bacterium]MCM1207264.1 hypothetical protein [Bacillota bacterium]MCM1500119.1 hypothetical protein [Clostridium sp.]